MTALHDVDVLVSLAEGAPGPARDWALARLALAEPDRATALPSDLADGQVALLAWTGRQDERLTAALARGSAAAPLLSAFALQHGLVASDAPLLIDALQGALRRPGQVAGAAMAMVWAGRADAVDLPAVARALAGAPAEREVLPALLLARARGTEADDVAAAVLQELRPQLAREPGRWWQIAAPLGLPAAPGLGRTDPDQAAEQGARWAGGTLTLPSPRGSRRHRGRKWILALLNGRSGPAAAWLRALATHGEPDADHVATAAWLALQSPQDDPVVDVLRGGAGHRPERLHAARRTIAGAHVPMLCEALTGPLPAGAPSLATAVRERHGAEVAPAMFTALWTTAADAQAAHPAAAVLAWHAPTRVVDLLADPEVRAVGLMLARFAPYEAVLAALLELPLPAEPDDRLAYAWALASMADGATLPLLAELAREDDGSLAAPLTLAEDLLRAPLR